MPSEDVDSLLASKHGAVQLTCGTHHGGHRSGKLTQPQTHSASTTDGSLPGGEVSQLNLALCDGEAHKFKPTSVRVKHFS